MFWSQPLTLSPFFYPYSLKLNMFTITLSAPLSVSFHLSPFCLLFMLSWLSSVLSLSSPSLWSSANQLPSSPRTYVINLSVYSPSAILLVFLLLSSGFGPLPSQAPTWYHPIFIPLLQGIVSKAWEPKRISGGFEATMVWVLKAIYIPKCCCSKSDFHARWVEGTF